MVSPPFRGGLYGAGVHSVLPLTGRGLAVANGEAGAERCDEPLNFAGILDIADETNPRLLSLLPVPRPGPGLGFANYCEKGGRFGPHNLHLPHHNPLYEQRDDLVYLRRFRRRCPVRKVDFEREVISVLVGGMRMEVPFEEVSFVEPPGVR